MDTVERALSEALNPGLRLREALDHPLAAGDACPLCGRTVELGAYALASGRDVLALWCADDGCPFVVLRNTTGPLFGTAAAAMGGEPCEAGHQHSWAFVRRIASRVDVVCARIAAGRVCGHTGHFLVGRPAGFANQVRDDEAARLARTKSLILRALLERQERLPEAPAMTAGMIATRTGLTIGQTHGALIRMAKGPEDRAFVYRSEKPAPLIPQGSAHTYWLTRRGEASARWYLQRDGQIGAQS